MAPKMLKRTWNIHFTQIVHSFAHLGARSSGKTQPAASCPHRGAEWTRRIRGTDEPHDHPPAPASSCGALLSISHAHAFFQADENLWPQKCKICEGWHKLFTGWNPAAAATQAKETLKWIHAGLAKVQLQLVVVVLSCHIWGCITWLRKIYGFYISCKSKPNFHIDPYSARWNNLNWQPSGEKEFRVKGGAEGSVPFSGKIWWTKKNCPESVAVLKGFGHGLLQHPDPCWRMPAEGPTEPVEIWYGQFDLLLGCEDFGEGSNCSCGMHFAGLC